VSEQILNGTSAQVGYTVPFMSVYTGKYVTEDQSKTDTLLKLYTTQKSKQHKTQQNKLPRFSRLLWHSVRKRGGLNAPEPTWGKKKWQTITICPHQHISLNSQSVNVPVYFYIITVDV